ncbi:MAG: amino acid-binding protein [Lachnospiraceae bacterium]|nr:amino acid-binding protein [Lachnospiraceae bacterium]
MTIKQLSVFLENREGRLEEVLNTLKEEKINIISLSLADTSDYGMLRILVEEPERGKDALKAKGFSATLSDIVAVTLPHKIGALQETLHILYEAGINIEYMYALCTTTDEAAIAIKPSDLQKAVEALEKAGAHFFDGLFK